jgi:hypothetical protein
LCLFVWHWTRGCCHESRPILGIASWTRLCWSTHLSFFSILDKRSRVVVIKWM